MTSRDFCYWLQGFFEVSGAKDMNEAQTEMVKRHLAMAFKHEIDPSYGDAKKQGELNQVHSGGGPYKDTIVRC